MPSFSTEVNHNLGREKAKQRLEFFLQKAAELYKGQIRELQGEWQEDTLHFKITTYGFHISGALAVEEEAVKMNGQLPFAAVAFRGKIEKSFAQELRRALT
jgi:hypothetical protein